MTEWEYHKGKSDAGRLDALDGPHDSRTGDLYQSEVVYTRRPYVTQVDVVWLVLDRHQQQQHSIDKLSTISENIRYATIRYRTVRYIYVRSKADEMASLV